MELFDAVDPVVEDVHLVSLEGVLFGGRHDRHRSLSCRADGPFDLGLKLDRNGVDEILFRLVRIILEVAILENGPDLLGALVPSRSPFVEDSVFPLITHVNNCERKRKRENEPFLDFDGRRNEVPDLEDRLAG